MPKLKSKLRNTILGIKTQNFSNPLAMVPNTCYEISQPASIWGRISSIVIKKGMPCPRGSSFSNFKLSVAIIVN